MAIEQLPPDLLSRIRHLLLPFVSTEDDRQALLTEAFYISEPRLYQQIDCTGSARNFTILCIKTLLNYGCLPDRMHSISRILETLRYDVGVDKQNEIDVLIEACNALCMVKREQESIPFIPTKTQAPINSIDTPHDARVPTIFISYSHTNSTFAQELITDLQRVGHACWVDKSEIKGGEEWMMTIAEGIINSYACLIITSRKALESRWVQDEILWARKKNKVIIPILLEDVYDDKRFFPLVSYQGIEFFGDKFDYQRAFQNLLRCIPNPQISVASLPPEPTKHDDLDFAMPSTGISTNAQQRKTELAYLERLRFEELVNSEKYTPMSGHSDAGTSLDRISFKPVIARPEFELLSQNTQKNAGETRRFEDAVSELKMIRRAVLLGEPGGGKTTTLWQFASKLLAAASSQKLEPIPLLIRLGGWIDDTQTLINFIQQELGQLGQYLQNLLDTNRAALLLDGMNEIPVAQRKWKYKQIQQFALQYTKLTLIITCRVQDYDTDLGLAKINITPLDPIRIRAFISRYLEDSSDKLFWKIAGEAARDYERRFRQAFAHQLQNWESVFWKHTRLPMGMNWGWLEGDNRYWNKWISLRDDPQSLLALVSNPYMLLMLTGVYANEGELPGNRGELFKSFVETLLLRENIIARDPNTHRPAIGEDATEFLSALAEVADLMQMERKQGDGAVNSVTALDLQQVQEILSPKQLYWASSTNILSFDTKVRFTHQLLQEYFVAFFMNRKIKEGRLKPSDMWQPDAWWERTNWEEATVLLAGLYSQDCTPVLNWIGDINPEVIAQCILRSHAYTPRSTLLKLRERWLQRIVGDQADSEPRSRAGVARALGLIILDKLPLDNRPGVSVSMYTGRSIPDISWIAIEGGEFQIQGKQHTMSSFWISKYPVTYSQFQTFVEADDFLDERWWRGLPKEDAWGAVWDVHEQGFAYHNHPRTMVSWYQATAFCRWLSHKTNMLITLPTEAQWEIAAGSRQGFLYSWGNKSIRGRANTKETKIYMTSAVGIFPEGKTAQGVYDMTGNVWEWCKNKFDEPDNLEEDDTGVARIQRGGTWDDPLSNASTTYRHWSAPDLRKRSMGIRLVTILITN